MQALQQKAPADFADEADMFVLLPLREKVARSAG
jgi:hypothetical protein